MDELVPRQVVGVAVSLAGEQAVSVTPLDTGRGPTMVGLRLGEVEVRFADAETAATATEWWEKSTALAANLPWAAGQVAPIGTSASPRVTVTLHEKDFRDGGTAFLPDVDGGVLQSGVGPLIMEFRDRAAFASVGAAVANVAAVAHISLIGRSARQQPRVTDRSRHRSADAAVRPRPHRRPPGSRGRS